MMNVDRNDFVETSFIYLLRYACMYVSSRLEACDLVLVYTWKDLWNLIPAFYHKLYY